MGEPAGSGIQPKLNAQAAAARAAARRYHQRLLRAVERKPYALSDEAREQRRLLLLVGTGVMLAFILWCSVRSPLMIEADVERRVGRLMQAERIDWAEVEVYGRSVRLYGVAPTQQARQRVVEAVDALAAVRRTFDHLLVGAPARGAAPESAEGAAAPMPTRLVLSFDGTKLVLRGQVGDEQGTTAVLQQAEKRYTREAVVSELTLAERSTADWRGAASSAVAALALLDTGRAVLADGRLTVSGAAPDATTLSALFDVLESETPRAVQLRVDVVPIYSRARPDPEGCRRALGIVTEAGELSPGPGFSGLTPTTRTTLDQVARLMQSCAAGLLVLLPATADEDRVVAERNFAEDLREHLLGRGVQADAVTLAEVPPAGASAPDRITLQLVLAEPPPAQ